MTPFTAEVYVAGCGPGSRDYVTPRVTALANKAQLLAGVPKLLNLFPESKARRMPQNGATEPWLDRLEATPARPCVVLVSGDPSESELTQQVVARFGRERCCIEPGISATQVVCAALGHAWQDVARFDLRTGLPVSLASDVAGHATCLFLMGAPGAEVLVAEIAEREQRQCLVVEDLALTTESQTMATTRELARMSPRAGRIVVVATGFD
jgi:cobalt-precorrin-7 (C5)-methyltransferase